MHQKKNPGGAFIIAALLMMTVFTIAAASLSREEGAAGAASSSSAPPEAETLYLEGLEAKVTREMAVNECGAEEERALRALAAERPELAARLNFMAEHLDIYSEAAVKTALQSEEKLDFALEIPFRTPDEGGSDAVIELTGGVPYLKQYDGRWGYHPYGSGPLGLTGCGPTCLAMAAAHLKGDASLNPARVADYAEENGYYAEGAGTVWTLFTEGAAGLDLAGEELPLDEGVMKSRLDSGAVLVLSMLPGDFTDDGHFIIIDKYDAAGFSVLDPNSPERSARWSFERLGGQIANLWALSA